MDAEDLKQLQAPIKARYKAEPDAAKHTFVARGSLLPQSATCRVETRLGPLDAGLHPAAGGDGSEACSGDMLLEALVACAGVTFNVVATAMAVRGVKGAGMRSSQPASRFCFCVRPPQNCSPRPQPVTTTTSPGFQSGWRLDSTVPARSMPGTSGQARTTAPLPVTASASL